MRSCSAALTAALVGALGLLPAPPASALKPPPASLAPPAAAPACPGPEAAAQAVRDAFDRLVAVHQGALPGPRRRELLDRDLSAWARAGFDAPTFARDVLRAAWDAADEPTRARWTLALSRLIDGHYRARLGDPTASTLEVLSAAGDCDRTAVAVRVHHRPSGTRRPLTLDLRHGPDGWRVRDVHVDGSSLVRLWRARFGRAFADGGLPALEAELARIPPAR